MYIFSTKVGIFSIVPKAGRWHAMFRGESLGSYFSPQQAADDLAGGHTFTPPGGFDTSKLGIPADISEWEHAR